jgi:hypothetical protein
MFRKWELPFFVMMKARREGSWVLELVDDAALQTPKPVAMSRARRASSCIRFQIIPLSCLATST